MKQKIIMPIAIVVLVGLIGFVIAEMTEVRIPIQKGWNLISFSVLTKINDNSDVKLSDIKYMYMYDINERKYSLIWKNGDFTNEAKTKYPFQRGEQNWLTLSSVWAYSEKSGTIKTWSEGRFRDISMFNLKQGWNFIFTVDGLQGESINNIKGDCDIEKAYAWDSESQKWEILSLEDVEFYLGPLDSLGAGLIIKVSSDCALGTIGGDIIDAPQLPEDNNQIKQFIKVRGVENYNSDYATIKTFEEYIFKISPFQKFSQIKNKTIYIEGTEIFIEALEAYEQENPDEPYVENKIVVSINGQRIEALREEIKLIRFENDLVIYFIAADIEGEFSSAGSDVIIGKAK